MFALLSQKAAASMLASAMIGAGLFGPATPTALAAAQTSTVKADVSLASTNTSLVVDIGDVTQWLNMVGVYDLVVVSNTDRGYTVVRQDGGNYHDVMVVAAGKNGYDLARSQREFFDANPGVLTGIMVVDASPDLLVKLGLAKPIDFNVASVENGEIFRSYRLENGPSDAPEYLNPFTWAEHFLVVATYDIKDYENFTATGENTITKVYPNGSADIVIRLHEKTLLRMLVAGTPVIGGDLDTLFGQYIDDQVRSGQDYNLPQGTLRIAPPKEQQEATNALLKEDLKTGQENFLANHEAAHQERVAEINAGFQEAGDKINTAIDKVKDDLDVKKTKFDADVKKASDAVNQLGEDVNEALGAKKTEVQNSLNAAKTRHDANVAKVNAGIKKAGDDLKKAGDDTKKTVRKTLKDVKKAVKNALGKKPSGGSGSGDSGSGDN